MAAIDAYTKLCISADGSDGTASFTDDAGKTVTNTGGFDSYTKCCSHFDGADGATAYTDPVAGAYTFVGTAQLDTADKEFGSASLLGDGNSDYASLPDSADWYFGTGNFTIDFWFKTSDLTAANGICGQYADTNNFWALFVATNGALTLQTYFAASEKNIYTGTGIISTGAWYHIAIVRASNVHKFYVNGTYITTTDNIGSGAMADIGGVLTVGAARRESGNWTYTNGWIDEFRVSKGIARWTANFTSPVAAYGQVLVSTTQKKLGTGSAYFDGYTYLTLADSDDFNFGSGDVTIDFWVRFAGLPGSTAYTPILNQLNTSAGWSIHLYTAAGGVNRYWRVYAQSATPAALFTIQKFTTVAIDTWYHVAIVRFGSTFKIFQNGVQCEDDGTDADAFPDSGEILQIGYDPSPNYLSGYLDEVRISKGVARWKSNFIVPYKAYGTDGTSQVGLKIQEGSSYIIA